MSVVAFAPKDEPPLNEDHATARRAGERLPTVMISTTRSQAKRPKLERGEILTAEGVILNQGIAERFRILRAKIERRNLANDCYHVISVTSALPQEGKSVTAVNLARAFGRNPRGRTLLIDCDLRKPSVHKFFGIELEGGLTDVLAGNKSLTAAIRSVEPGLDVITAGRLVSDPARIIDQPLFKHHLNELRKQYSYVVIDCPPTLLCPEPISLSSMTDATIFVVRAWRTERSVVRDALKVLGRDKILGVVVNDSVEASRQRSYYDYYGYSYSSQAPELSPSRVSQLLCGLGSRAVSLMLSGLKLRRKAPTAAGGQFGSMVESVSE